MFYVAPGQEGTVFVVQKIQGKEIKMNYDTATLTMAWKDCTTVLIED